MSTNKDIVPFGNWFDTVRAREKPETVAAGVAGRVGQAYGETVPSCSGVTSDEIIGEPIEDYAVNVYFDEQDEDFWFTRDLLEFVAHTPGTQVEVGGKTMVQTESGEWVELPRRGGKSVD